MCVRFDGLGLETVQYADTKVMNPVGLGWDPGSWPKILEIDNNVV